jgi:hypothetical protein
VATGFEASCRIRTEFERRRAGRMHATHVSAALLSTCCGVTRESDPLYVYHCKEIGIFIVSDIGIESASSCTETALDLRALDSSLLLRFLFLERLQVNRDYNESSDSEVMSFTPCACILLVASCIPLSDVSTAFVASSNTKVSYPRSAASIAVALTQ